jgi:Family of unknown function (DUF6279)
MITTSSLMRSSLSCERFCERKFERKCEPRIIGTAPVTGVRRWCRGVTAAALWLAVCTLAGCSSLPVRLGYSQGAMLTYWWADRHANFNDDQAPLVRAALAQWFDWHRRTQLADDLALLERAAAEAEGPVTAAQACGWWAVVEQRRDAYLAPLAAPLAEIAPTLSPAQWRHIQQRFDTVNADWRDKQLDPDPAQRERAAIDRLVERVELLYGRLDRAQIAFVGDWVRRSPWNAQRWLDDRVAHQRDALQTLRLLATPGQTPAAREALTRAWLARMAQPSDETARRYRDSVLENQCAFAAEMQVRSTPVQRRHAADTLRGWAQDLRGFVPTSAP